MNYETLSKKILDKEYDSKLPYPPYRPDKVDREKMKETDKLARLAYEDDDYRLRQLYETDLRKFIEDEIGKTLTDKQYQTIFTRAWDDGHASGYYEVMLEAFNLVEVIKEFLN